MRGWILDTKELASYECTSVDVLLNIVTNTEICVCKYY